MSLEAYKAFSSVVHNAPAADLKAGKAFASVVHNAPAADLKAGKAFASVVHNAPAADLKAGKVFASVVHTLSTTPPVVGVWPQEGNARMVNVQGQRLKRNRGQL